MAAILLLLHLLPSTSKGKKKSLKKSTSDAADRLIFKDRYLNIFYFICQFIWLSRANAYFERARNIFALVFQCRSSFVFIEMNCIHFN